MSTNDHARNGSPTLSPVPARASLDAHFLEVRCKLLDLAAALDRIGRGAGAAQAEADPRLGKVREALEVLRDRSGGRAERVQQFFSLEYDPTWERPEPR
jgi:hypothetical protein